MSRSPQRLAKTMLLVLEPGWRHPKRPNVDGGIINTKKRHRALKILRSQGITSPTEIARHTGISSDRTAKNYGNAFKQFFEYVRDEYGINKFPKITGDHARTFMLKKVDEINSAGSFAVLAAAMNKLTVGLGRIQNTEIRWTAEIADARKEAYSRLGTEVKSRGYLRPEDAIAKLEDPHMRMCARAQLTSGARISEIFELTKENLATAKVNQLKLTNTKGGRIRTVDVPADVYKYIVDQIQATGKFTFNRAQYADQLRTAFHSTQQTWSGSHGFRHTFAQRTYAKMIADGNSYHKTLRTISHMLGHTRAGIVRIYLR